MSDAQSSAKQPDNANHVRFPPFPLPPPGVNIVLFKDFKECGIKVYTENDEVEIDGRNVPTVELRHKHEADTCKTNAKRKRKKINSTVNGTGASPIPISAPIQRKEWWQTWEEDEEQRLYRYDSNFPRIDRLLAATADFKSRPWPVGLHTLWDQFRLFVGLLTNTPVARKGDGGKSALDDDSEEEYDTDGDPGVQVPLAQMPSAEDVAINGTSDNVDDVGEERMNDFLDDPQKIVKIFLSSYMRRQGLIWADRNLTLFPRLLSFFLRFLLRNKVFPESSYERSLRSALEVAKLAITELPLTSKMAKTMPDQFNEGCKECWGPRSDGYKTLPPLDTPDGTNGTDRDTKRQRLDDADDGHVRGERHGDTTVSKSDVDTFEAELLAANVAVVPPGEGINLAREIITDNLDNDDGGWGIPPTKMDVGWGSEWATEANSNGDSNVKSSTDESWFAAWQIPVQSLMHLLGPTALPNTHTTGIVESSMRRIMSVTEPSSRVGAAGGPEIGAGAVESELATRFARVVLAPWMGWEGKDEVGYSEPKIQLASRGAVVGYEGQGRGGPKAHDPRKDEITVLFDSSVVPSLSVGMGIGAIWVQIIRQEEEVVTSNGHSKKGKTKAKKTKETYWYMEELSMTFPSYYTPM